MAKDVDQTVSFDYDRPADVLQITFGTGEPSFSEEMDDHIVIDFGIYTGAPTGLQILHVKEVGINPRALYKRLAPVLLARKRETLEAMLSEREQMMKNAMDSLATRLKELVPA